MLVHLGLIGQRVSGYVAIRLARASFREPRVVGMVAEVAEQLRVSWDVALRRRVEPDLTDPIREIGMLGHVAEKRRMARNGTDRQR